MSLSQLSSKQSAALLVALLVTVGVAAYFGGGTPILDSGAYTHIRWNKGYNTEYSASTNNVTLTTWTFVTGLDVAPVRVYASFNETGITSWKWSYATGTITITSGVTIPYDDVLCYVTAYSWNEP